MENQKTQMVYWVDINKVDPNPYQPRKEFDDEALLSLSSSIKQYGVLQPLVVTKKEEYTDSGMSVRYELIAGERRLRASKLAKQTQVPVIIKEGENSNQFKLEIAIIENIQREDLRPVDRAEAIQQLIDEFGLTHEMAAEKVGKSRQYVTNTLRLLSLPADMLPHINSGVLSEGHARVLLTLITKPVEQRLVFNDMLKKKLTVRDSIRLSHRLLNQDNANTQQPKPLSLEFEELEKKITDALGTRVQIEKNKKGEGGKLLIDFFSMDDLNNFLNIVEKKDESAIQRENNEEQGKEEQVEQTDNEDENRKKGNNDDLYNLDNFTV